MAYAILSLILGVAVLNGTLFVRQPGMVFFPQRQLDATPRDWGLVYEDVGLVTADGITLHGWYIPQVDARRTVLFFHGNAGNISHRGESLEIFHRLGVNVLIIDYRGYGRSTGKPDEPGLSADADAAWLYLTRQRAVDGKDIILFGRSLGGAVAADLATRVQAGGLILESTFSSARDVARSLFPLLSFIIVQRFDFDVAAHVKNIHCPVLVLHSPEDEIIPFRLGEKVYAAANEPKTFMRLQGDHNGGFLRTQPHYEQALARFIATL